MSAFLLSESCSIERNGTPALPVFMPLPREQSDNQDITGQLAGCRIRSCLSGRPSPSGPGDHWRNTPVCGIRSEGLV